MEIAITVIILERAFFVWTKKYRNIIFWQSQNKQSHTGFECYKWQNFQCFDKIKVFLTKHELKLTTLSQLPLLSISPIVSRPLPSCRMSLIGIANEENLHPDMNSKLFTSADETAFPLKAE